MHLEKFSLQARADELFFEPYGGRVEAVSGVATRLQNENKVRSHSQSMDNESNNPL